jgi:hypothetical protein
VEDWGQDWGPLGTRDYSRDWGLPTHLEQSTVGGYNHSEMGVQRMLCLKSNEMLSADLD